MIESKVVLPSETCCAVDILPLYHIHQDERFEYQINEKIMYRGVFRVREVGTGVAPRLSSPSLCVTCRPLVEL